MKKHLGLILISAFFFGCSTGIKTAQRTDTKKPGTPPPGVGLRPQKSGSGAQFIPVRTAQGYLDAKEYQRTLQYVGTALENPALQPQEREALWQIRMKAFEASKDINGYSIAPISEPELLVNVNTATQANFRSMTFLKLGEGKLLEHKQEEAREYFNRVIGDDPSSEVAARAQEYLKNMETLRRVEAKTIGVVLPLTGKNARVAQRVLRGIQLGLGLNGRGASSFRLAVVDSEGSPELARQGVEKLLEQDNVIAIIGGLISRTAAAEAAQAAESGVPTISLSLRQGITEMGPRIFRNSLTTEMQVQRLVKTAMEELNYKRFAILYPNDSYGVEAANLFWDEVLARGGQITAAQTYSPKETDYRDVIQRLTGTFFPEARPEEAKLKAKEIKEAQEKKAKALRSNTQENLLAPILDFEAIFIPDGMKALGQMSATLAYSDVKNVKLLGTNLWNAPGVGKRATNFANNLLFVDSYTNTDPRFQNLLFVKEYTQLFKEEPGLFEIQGYDSALILRQLISQGATSRETLASALGQMNNLPGLLSPLSVLEDREIVRPVVALTVEKDTVVPFRAPAMK